MRADSSNRKTSELVRLLALRVPGAGGDHNRAMTVLAARLRQSVRWKGLATPLDRLIRLRNVLEVEIIPDLNYDGSVRPLADSFDGGFRMELKGGGSRSRIRFTTAHELCHTFFYEFVPELKFCPHEVDQDEERLCNLGAAELLMPSATLRNRCKGLSICLDSLETLAGAYDVSINAMFLRLRSLKLWHSELSTWHHMTGGGFALHRLLGGRPLEWTWPNESVLEVAWKTGRQLAGRTYLELRDADGGLKLRPVTYQVSRRGDALVALWSHPSVCPPRTSMPLFERGSH